MITSGLKFAQGFPFIGIGHYASVVTPVFDTDSTIEVTVQVGVQTLVLYCAAATD